MDNYKEIKIKMVGDLSILGKTRITAEKLSPGNVDYEYKVSDKITLFLTIKGVDASIKYEQLCRTIDKDVNRDNVSVFQVSIMTLTEKYNIEDLWQSRSNTQR